MPTSTAGIQSAEARIVKARVYSDQERSDFRQRYNDTFVKDKHKDIFYHIEGHDWKFGSKVAGNMVTSFTPYYKDKKGERSDGSYEETTSFVDHVILERPSPSCYISKGLGYFQYVPEKVYKRTFNSSNLQITVMSIAPKHFSNSNIVQLCFGVFFPEYHETLTKAVNNLLSKNEFASLIDRNFSICCSKNQDFLFLFYRDSVVGIVNYKKKTITSNSLLSEEIKDLLNKDMGEAYALQSTT